MTKPGAYRHVGRRSAELQAIARTYADAQPIVTSCAFCDWTVTAPAGEGRQQAAQHRASAHPTVKATRRRRGSLQRFGVSEDSFRQEGNANAAEIAAMHRRRNVA